MGRNTSTGVGGAEGGGRNVHGHYTLHTHEDMSKINISEGEIFALPQSYHIQIAHNYNVKIKKPPKHFFVLCAMFPPVKWVYFLKKKPNSMTETETETQTERKRNIYKRFRVWSSGKGQVHERHTRH